MLSEIL